MPSNVYRKPSGRWGARITVDGRTIPLGTYDLKAEARDAVAAHRRTTTAIDPSTLTINEVVDKWDASKVATLSPSTQLNYRRAAKRLKDEFGDRRAVTIAHDELSSWALNQTRTTVQTTYTIFEWARTTKTIRMPENPAANLTSRPPAWRHEVKTLTEAELLQLEDAAYTLPLRIAGSFAALIIVAGRTALRPGELFALRWRDIDFEAETITVRRSVDVTGAEKAPKNGKVRTIALTQMAKERLLLLPQGEDDDLVFVNTRGDQLRKTTFARWFDKIRDRADLEGFRFYDLRHTALTYLFVDLGLPSYVVAAQAGHSDNGRLIEQRYGHPQHAQSLELIRAAERRVSADQPENPGGVSAGYPEVPQYA